MLKQDRISRRLLKLPEELSEQTKQSIIEQARYNTFTRRGALARFTTISVLVVLSALVIIVATAFALVTLTPLATAGPIPKALITGLVIGCGGFLATVIQQSYYARLLRPEIDRLLGSVQGQPDEK